MLFVGTQQEIMSLDFEGYNYQEQKGQNATHYQHQSEFEGWGQSDIVKAYYPPHSQFQQ